MSEASLYEQELYMAITLAWYQAQPQGFHLDRVLRPFVLGTGFAESVEGHRVYLELHRVAAICTLLVCSRPWELDGLQKVLDVQGIGRVPKDELDPVCAWWYPLAPSPNLLGIHYWELGSGIVELKRLSKFEKPPVLQFGRYAAQKRQRGAADTGRRRTSSR
ncbi:MAG TPA: hypothetical protein VIJ39_12615 [Solirubrobacteraceae bacterium]